MCVLREGSGRAAGNVLGVETIPQNSPERCLVIGSYITRHRRGICCKCRCQGVVRWRRRGEGRRKVSLSLLGNACGVT